MQIINTEAAGMRFDVAAFERSSPTETINLCASAEQKALIDRAARRLGKSRNEFVLDTMREAAENVLLDQCLFSLDEATFSAFEAMLARQVAPCAGRCRRLRLGTVERSGMSPAVPEPIRPDHDPTRFDSGQPTLDAWLASCAEE